MYFSLINANKCHLLKYFYIIAIHFLCQRIPILSELRKEGKFCSLVQENGKTAKLGISSEFDENVVGSQTRVIWITECVL